MSATKNERLEVKLAREEWDRKLAAQGHEICWKLGPNATRKGSGYFLEGTCRNCGAYMQLGAGFTTSHGPRDARHVTCSGPGTAILTEIEAQRLHELCAPIIANFVQALGEITEGAEHA